MGWKFCGGSIIITNQNDIINNQSVPAINSVENLLMSQVIGNKLDNEFGDSIYSLLYILDKHFHANAVVYPLLANPVTLQKATGVWADFPAIKTEVIPANTIALPFDIHFVSTTNLSAAGNYIIAIYAGGVGAEVLIAYTVATRTAIGGTEGMMFCQTPVLPANTRISCALSSGNNAQDTLQIKLHYHVY